MQVKLKELGNSQCICFPKEVLKAAGFSSDDILLAEVHDGKIVLSRGFQRHNLQESTAWYNGQLNLPLEMKREEPVGSEVW